jgi:hypothetical protein
MASPATDLPFEEWMECRTSIGRFDSIIADTRKFGFTLVTGLLTANALVTGSGSGHSRASIVAAVIIEALTFALYLLDRYYWVLLLESVTRATELEKDLKHLELTQRLSKFAHTTQAVVAASLVYFVFLAVAAMLPLLIDEQVTVWTWFPVAFGILLAGAMWLIYDWTNKQLTDKTKHSAEITHRTA